MPHIYRCDERQGGPAFFHQACWGEPRVCPTKHDDRIKHIRHACACGADDCFLPGRPTCMGVFEVLAVRTIEMTRNLPANAAFDRIRSLVSTIKMTRNRAGTEAFVTMRILLTCELTKLRAIGPIPSIEPR